MKKKLTTLVLLVSLVSGCAVGPDYKRPTTSVPSTYRGLTPEQAAEAGPASLADLKWWEVFQDEQLQGLIRTALQQNYDVRIAATRILQAQAQLGITRADQFPTVTAGDSLTRERTSAEPTVGLPPIKTNVYEVNGSFNWELDFWGKFRRATEAAQANLLASQWAREEVISTLVSNVAAAYFQLRELDLELEISQRTLGTRQDSLKLTRSLEVHGATSMLDVRQAEQLVFTAAEEIPDLERRIEQEENFISILLGNNPGAVPRGRRLTDQPHAPEVPAGLPSSLLERRPDIRQAEENLIAANARIGVAKAAYFPQITLTATGGYQSFALSDLFTGPAGLWSFVGALTQPIFEGGRIRSGVRLAKAQQQETLLTYQQTIQGAFRDVSDALIAYRKNQEFRIQQEHLAESAKDAARLSDMRYRGGVTSYLEVLTNDTNYFTAELGLAQAQLNELLALVQVYKALGGGWEQRSLR
jgi:outer membrane protein, multidrug efflux system